MNCKNTYEINKEEQCNESQLFFLEIMVALLIYVHISSGGMVMFVFSLFSRFAPSLLNSARRRSGVKQELW